MYSDIAIFTILPFNNAFIKSSKKETNHPKILYLLVDN